MRRTSRVRQAIAAWFQFVTFETTLRWPDGRGKFVDDGRPGDGTDGRDRLTVYAGDTVTVSDGDRADQYQDRGFEVVDGDDSGGADGSEGDTDGDEPTADGGFDVEAFIDRTPVTAVVDDIEAGDVDDQLGTVADAAERVTVEKAVEDRQDAIGGD